MKKCVLEERELKRFYSTSFVFMVVVAMLLWTVNVGKFFVDGEFLDVWTLQNIPEEALQMSFNFCIFLGFSVSFLTREEKNFKFVILMMVTVVPFLALFATVLHYKTLGMVFSLVLLGVPIAIPCHILRKRQLSKI